MTYFRTVTIPYRQRQPLLMVAGGLTFAALICAVDLVYTSLTGFGS